MFALTSGTTLLILYFSRVGFTSDTNKQTFVLPCDVSEITSLWDVGGDVPRSCYDFLWSSQADETREKILMSDAFVLQDRGDIPEGDIPESVCIGEAALKVGDFARSQNRRLT